MNHKKNPSQKEMPKHIRFRLLVSIPLILTTFTLGSGFLVLNLTQYISFTALPSKELLLITGTILFLTIVACICGIMLAYGITNPLKRLTTSAESFIKERGEELTKITATNELDVLTTIFDKAFISINELIQDSYILDNLSEGIITLNFHEEITDLNSTATKFLDSDSKQLKGRHIKEIFPASEGNNLFFHLVDEGWKGKKLPLQEISLFLPGKKMEPFWMKISLSKGKRPRQMFIILKNPKEIKDIRDQIRKIEQLALLGTLASGVAHEVRNPLGSLRGLTELISEDLPPDDQKRLYIENMLREIDRLNCLVEDILNFSQNPMSRIEPTDIDQILSQTISLARYNFPQKDIQVTRKHQTQLPLLPADAERLTQAFLNLFINAFEAIPEGGKIEVKRQKAKGKRVIVTISDNGPGITRENLSQIFNPFYTTKEKGTGLGLTIAQRIITAHGGNIEVKSTPGQGATFRVMLPVEV